MAKIRVPIFGTVGKSVRLNPDATKGATIGENLYAPDGSLVGLKDGLLQVNNQVQATTFRISDYPELVSKKRPAQIESLWTFRAAVDVQSQTDDTNTARFQWVVDEFLIYPTIPDLQYFGVGFSRSRFSSESSAAHGMFLAAGNAAQPDLTAHGQLYVLEGTPDKIYFKPDGGTAVDLTEGFDASSDQTITGAWTFSNSLDVTGEVAISSNLFIGAGGDQRITATDDIIEIGAGTSSFLLSTQDGNGRVQMKWNATHGTGETYLVSSEPATQWLMDRTNVMTVQYAPSGTAGGSISWQTCLDVNDDTVGLYYDGNLALETQDYTADGNSTGANVRHNNGSLYDVGMNVMPRFLTNTNAILAHQHAGGFYYHNNSTTYTITLNDTAGQGASFPVGGMLFVINYGSGNITVNTGSGSLYVPQLGSATTGSRTIGGNSVATILKYAANTWFLWGDNVS